MKLIRSGAALLAVCMLTACNGQNLGSDAVDLKAPAAPVFRYFLPKQVYTVTVKYQLAECPPEPRFRAYSGKELKIKQEATIVEASVADPAQQFEIPFTALGSALKDVTFEASVYPSTQTLKAVGVDIEDKTGAFIKNFLTAGFAIARLATGLPAPAAAPLFLPTPTSACTDKTYNTLISIEQAQKKLLATGLTPKERQATLAGVEQLQATLVQKIVIEYEPGKVAAGAAANPTCPALGSITTTCGGLKDLQLARWINNIDDKVRALAKTQVGAKTHGVVSGDMDKAIGGIEYREPAQATILVCKLLCDKEANVYEGTETSVAQLGPRRVMTLRNRVFEKNNFSLSFAANGVLETAKYGSAARAERASAVLVDTVSQVGGFIDQKRAADKAKREAENNAELTTLQTETTLLTAKSDKIEAERRYLDLVNGKPAEE